MRKLLIAGVAVASLTGIAYAQVERQDSRESWAQALNPSNRPTTCRDGSGVVRNLGETTTAARSEFRCVQVWGDGLNGLSTGWLLVTPPPAAR